jgi:hypothetical protein
MAARALVVLVGLLAWQTPVPPSSRQEVKQDDDRVLAAQAETMFCVANCFRIGKLSGEAVTAVLRANALPGGATQPWNPAEQAFATCSDKCGKTHGVSREHIAALFGAIQAAGRRGGGGGSLPGFECKPNEDVCTCKGFFDCKKLEKSGCCADPVDVCTIQEGEGEVCSCTKSKKCGAS